MTAMVLPNRHREQNIAIWTIRHIFIILPADFSISGSEFLQGHLLKGFL